ncbi:hypothetical protein R4Y45_03320 [Holzapfeliella sp. He02]|uniref:Uncharacterized protein n=1 Tax=Holzapfeliella saturejae TaxID=3082953 RepID=A0ABU8SH56_9LACO
MKIKQPAFILLENMVSFLLMVSLLMTFAGTMRYVKQLEVQKSLVVNAHLAAVMLKNSTKTSCQIENDWFVLVSPTKIQNVTQKIIYEI